MYKAYWLDQVPAILQQSSPGDCLPYGLGRSYGDSCLNDGRTLIDCSRLNRILSFDRQTGRIVCEAGTSLADVIDIVVSEGWFLPVTPGTKFVTVGGAIANDVHGKNHHRSGSFGLHVSHLLLCRSDLGLIECGRNQNVDLFRATIGGLGLTGVILSAEIELKRISGNTICSDSIPFNSLSEFLSISAESDSGFEYTAAWIDCFHQPAVRGILFRGNHGEHTRKTSTPGNRLKIPFTLPTGLVNRTTVGVLNAVYYQRHSRGSTSVVPFDQFFYPLDSVRDWNLAYGAKGLLQYQCVVPDSTAAAIEEVLARVANDGSPCCLCVLKRFGSVKSAGTMSFPRPGLTVTLDFPMRGPKILRLLESLDEVVSQAGGALYPAKDARMSPEMFRSSFPEWRAFSRFIDPALSSSFWRRVTETKGL